MSAKGRLEAFPPGITVEGATPENEGWKDGQRPGHLSTGSWHTSGQKGGFAPSTSSPSRAAPRRAVRGGGHAGRRPTALYRGGLGESVSTHVQCGFPGTALTTAARAAPYDSAVLWLPNACTTCMRHPTLVRWPAIRRHGRAPRRRKSSIILRPLEAGSSCSH